MEIFKKVSVVILLSVSISAIFSVSSYSAEAVIYRWVDENNVVHFSQYQPEHENYTTMNAPLDVRNNQTLEKTAKTQKEQLSAESQNSLKEPVELSPEMIAERCQEAQNNVKTLTEFEAVQVKDKDGKLRLLTAEEMKTQLTFNQQQVKEYCKK